MKNHLLGIVAGVALALFGLALFCSVKVIHNSSTVRNCYTAGQYATENREWNSAISNYTEIIRLRPREAMAYVHRAYAYHYRDDLDKAIGDYTEAFRLNPADVYSVFSRGLAYGSKGEFDKAIADFGEAIRIDPGKAEYHKFRGQSYAYKKEWDKALQDVQRAILLDPNDPTNYVERANYYAGKGDLDKALAGYAEAIRLAPTLAGAYLNRAHVYLQQNQIEEALAALHQAMQLDAKDPMTCNGLAWILATSPEAKLRNGQQAVELAGKACELSDWKQTHYVDTLAAAYAEVGDFEQAVKFQKQVISMEKVEKLRVEEKERLTLYEQGKPYREKFASVLSRPHP